MLLVAGCGTSSPSSPPTAPGQSPEPTTVRGTASATPPAPAVSPTSAAASATATASGSSAAFRFILPASWRIAYQDAEQVWLTHGPAGTMDEEIRFAVDIGQEQTDGSPVILVDGKPAHVLREGIVDGSFDEVLAITDGSRHFVFDCVGYAGSSTSQLQHDCQAFLAGLTLP
jgi:hypothetical protein